MSSLAVIKEVEESKEEEQPLEEMAVPKKKPEQQQSIMDAARSEALRPFVIISTSYLLFTVTDGAIRMIVLLHAYNENFSAFEVALMFTLYELAGVVTNLAAGVMGAKWGIRFTLIIGLSLQLVSYALLFGWQDDWSKESSIIYVTVAQLFAGVAKDLTKLGGKTVTKLVTPEEQETKLFKLVSLITGWKNSLKGVGYFLGSALLQVSYELALAVMMGLVALAMPWAIIGLDKNLGTAKKSNASWSDIFNLNNRNLNILSLARLFLFASRDFWFEVPLPFFLRSPSCEGLGVDQCMSDGDCGNGAECSNDFEGVCQNINSGGGCGGLGLDRVVVGAFLGGYIILYGQVQSWTPQLVTGPLGQTPPNKLTEVFWGLINCIPTLIMTIVLAFAPAFDDYDRNAMIGWMVTGIITFAIIFAINSSIHSYLVVKYASTEKIAVSVGFYYMSNAMGRLFGTLGSGLLYTYVGDDKGDLAGNDAVAALAACFFAGTLSSLTAALITVRIEDDDSGLKCGSCCVLVKGKDDDEHDIEAVNKAMMLPRADGERWYHLVIVESDAKCQVITKILEQYVEDCNLLHDYVIKSTSGTVRDLASESSKKDSSEQSIAGVDVDNDYKPIFQVLPGKKPLMKKLRSLAHEAQKVVLATDADREGETLAWHISKFLPADTPCERIVFAELTPNSIREAIENPRNLDMKQVEAVIAESIFDRLSECTVSPVLERKIAPGLSAGRLESVAMEILVQRERERLSFEGSKCWLLKAAFGEEHDIEATMVAFNGVLFAAETDYDSDGSLVDDEKLLLTPDRADELLYLFTKGEKSPILQDPDISHWTVTSVQEKELKIGPPRPFKTVTLLQQSYERLGMSVSETIKTAQSLYEAGCISFFHTDSTVMCQDAHRATEAVILENYGANMLAPPRKTCRMALNGTRDVQEAVRPAVQADGSFLQPGQLPVSDPSATRLYELIYQRTLASRMSHAVVNKISVEITGKAPNEDDTLMFLASGRTLLSPGYTTAWRRSSSEQILPPLVIGQMLECANMHTVHHIAQPPSRYNESSFIEELDVQLGCHPCTYSKTIQNLCNKAYVAKPTKAGENDQLAALGSSYRTVNGADTEECDGPLVPSLSAFVVCSLLERYCPTYVDITITSFMHQRLDEVARGVGSEENRCVSYIEEFYAGEHGLAADVKYMDEEVSPEEARRARLPTSFLNSEHDEDEDEIGLFVSPEGSYAQKIAPGETDGAEEPPIVSLPPKMAADISTINHKALRELLAAREKGGLFLGSHPDDGREIRLIVGKLGAYLQLGETGAEGTTTHTVPAGTGELEAVDTKPVDDNSVAEESPGVAIGLTLDDAINYVNLPRTVCELKDEPIVAAIGPFGPYLKYKHRYISIKKQDGDANTIDPATAQRIVTEEVFDKHSEHGKRVVTELGMKQGGMILVKEGRYGRRHICWKKKSVQLPTEYHDSPEDMPVEEAWALVQIQSDKSKKNLRRPPQKSKSAYLFFCAERRHEVTQTVESSGDLSENKVKMNTSVLLAKMWQDLASDGGQARYEELAAADQARYEEEMELYRSQSLVGMDVLAVNYSSETGEESSSHSSLDSTEERRNGVAEKQSSEPTEEKKQNWLSWGS